MKGIMVLILGMVLTLRAQPALVTATGQASLEELSQREAVEKALLRARRQAIEKACGANINAVTVVNNFTTMADVIENLTRAHVEVLDSSISYTQEKIPGYAQPVLIVHATITAQVQCGVNRPPAFQLKGGLSRTTLMHGDTLHFWVQATEPVYLNIFDVGENGEVRVVYPSPFLQQQKIPAHTRWYFPFPLRAECPEGKRRSGEWLYIIATRTPISMIPAKIRYQKVETPEGGLMWKSSTAFLQDIVETLMRIPPEDRQELRLFFEVRR